MSLIELYNRAALTDKSIVPFCKEMAKALDDLDARIEDRRVSEPLIPRLKQATDATFHQRMERTNGYGDVLNCVRDMAAAVDKLNEWMGASAAENAEHAEQKRRGRPPNPKRDAA
jgi:hypothetical protein